MNIDDLTIGQAKELSSLFGKSEAKSNGLNSLIGQKCIVRTFSAGVWFGTLKEKSSNEIYLENARRINYYKTVKGISLSSVANNGVHADSRIAEPTEIVWLQPIELIRCTEVAINSIEGHASE